MHHPRRRASIAGLLLSSAVLATATAQAAEPESGHSLKDVNFTGPLITANPAGTSKGHWYIEPYLVRSESSHSFDDAGDRQRRSSDSAAWKLIVPIAYGLGERVTGQVNLSAARAESGNARSSGFRTADTTAKVQYLLQKPSADGTRPAVSVSLAQRFTTGQHDRISGNPLDAQGDGVQRTTAALGVQQVLWMSNGRPLRWRGQFSASPAPADTSISGVSVYGTSDGFRGHVARGSVLGLSLAAEYSINSRWVAVMEVAASRESAGRLSGFAPDGSGGMQRIDTFRPASRSISIAPAVEYNFSSSVGLIAGVEITVAGRNAGQAISPQIALGMFF